MKNEHITSPLSAKDVQKEAKTLERLADQFLSGNDENGAFQKWHDELINLSRSGEQSARAVFRQIQKDNGGINPLLPHVDLINDGKGILVMPSIPQFVLTANQRSIAGGINLNTGRADNLPGSTAVIHSTASAGRNFIVGQHDLERLTITLSDESR